MKSNIMTLEEIISHKSFKRYINPIKIDVYNSFQIIGVFPYTKARINNVVPIPISIVYNIINYLPSSDQDNKYVIVCQVTKNYGARNFAIYVCDSWCKIGKLNQIEVLW